MRKPDCKVCGRLCFKAGWAATMIHSKETLALFLKLLPQHEDRFLERNQAIFQNLRKQGKKLMK